MFDEELQNLLPADKRLIWRDYRQYLDLGWRHFGISAKLTDDKEHELKLLEKALRKEFNRPRSMLARLQKEFVAENISAVLLTEPLASWRYLAAKQYPADEKQLTAMLNNIVSAQARLLMVLNDEHPSLYLPMTSLVLVLHLLKLLQDKAALLGKMHWTRKQQSRRLYGLLKSAEVLLQIAHSKRLKIRLALLINKCKFAVDAYKNNKQCKIGYLDAIKIYLYSILQFVTIRHKTVEKKGL